MKQQAVRLETEAVDHLEELVQRVESLELQIQQIFERNQRVESQKNWETSGYRIFTIAILTYCFTACVFFLLGVEAFLLSACIPTLGYLLSCMSLAHLRKRLLLRQSSLTESKLRKIETAGSQK